MQGQHHFYGEKLRLARLLSNWTLDDLGERVSASRQYIHQLETGAKEPASEMISALAAAVGVRQHFFSSLIKNPVREEDCHFRKLFTVPRAISSQAAARGTAIEMLVDALDQKLKLPKIDFCFESPKPSSMDKIELIAEAARQHWRLGMDAPITNMTRVLENAGAVVVHFEDISDRIDALSIARRRPIVVRSSSKTAAVRLRFDLAHECGHLVMHQGIVTGDHETEKQAHRFASSFLLPRHAFAKEFPRSRILDWNGMLNLKKRWKVSIRAIVRRAYDLGLIDAAQYRTGNVHLSKTGQAKFEKLDDTIEKEKAELLHAAMTKLERHSPIALFKIIEDLGFTTSLVERITGHVIRELPKNVILMNV